MRQKRSAACIVKCGEPVPHVMTEALMEMGLIDNEFVADVLAVDFTNRLFSAPLRNAQASPNRGWTRLSPSLPSRAQEQFATCRQAVAGQPHRPKARCKSPPPASCHISLPEESVSSACWCIDGPKWIGPS